jgi:hypothetical protein
MTHEEEQAFGAMAGWSRCEACDGFVRPWWLPRSWPLVEKVERTIHLYCWLVYIEQLCAEFGDDAGDDHGMVTLFGYADHVRWEDDMG